jgi:hypothetical protein
LSTPTHTIEPRPARDQRPTKPRDAESSLLIDFLNLVAGALLVYSGLLDKLWETLEPPIPWRTGPPAQETLIYIALIALGWLIFNLLLRGLGLLIARCMNPDSTIENLKCPSPQSMPPPNHSLPALLTLRAARFVVSAAILTVIQVLMLPLWPLLAAVLLLPAFIFSQHEMPIAHRLLNWAWCATGIGLAGLLIHPAFQADPRFISRLALILTAWRIIGQLPPLRLKATEIWTPDWAG